MGAFLDYLRSRSRFSFVLYKWRRHLSSTMSQYLTVHMRLLLFCFLLIGSASALFSVPCKDDFQSSPSTGTCVKYSNDHKNFEDARADCKKLGSDLVRIELEEFNQELLDYIDKNFNGGSVQLLGIRWLPEIHTNWTWLDDNETALFNKFTSPTYENKSCSFFNHPNDKSGNWYPQMCSDQTGYICQKGSTKGDLCPPGYVPNHYSGTCFKLNQVRLTYKESKKACQAEGGDLAIIYDQNTNAMLYALVNFKYKEDAVYIGMDDLKEEGTMRWLGFDDQVPYTNWDDGQPNNKGDDQDCVVMNHMNVKVAGKWNDVNCEEPLLSFCEIFPDCVFAMYGATCSANCSKCKGQCNPKTGSCDLCISGYLGTKCTEKCANNTYGFNCLETCSENCAGAQGCDHMTGKCLGGCKAGFTGDKCDQTVEEGGSSLLIIIVILLLLVLLLGAVGIILKNRKKAGAGLDAGEQVPETEEAPPEGGEDLKEEIPDGEEGAGPEGRGSRGSPEVKAAFNSESRASALEA